MPAATKPAAAAAGAVAGVKGGAGSLAKASAAQLPTEPSSASLPGGAGGAQPSTAATAALPQLNPALSCASATLNDNEWASCVFAVFPDVGFKGDKPTGAVFQQAALAELVGNGVRKKFCTVSRDSLLAWVAENRQASEVCRDIAAALEQNRSSETVDRVAPRALKAFLLARRAADLLARERGGDAGATVKPAQAPPAALVTQQQTPAKPAAVKELVAAAAAAVGGGGKDKDARKASTAKLKAEDASTGAGGGSVALEEESVSRRPTTAKLRDRVPGGRTAEGKVIPIVDEPDTAFSCYVLLCDFGVDAVRRYAETECGTLDAALRIRLREESPAAAAAAAAATPNAPPVKAGTAQVRTEASEAWRALSGLVGARRSARALRDVALLDVEVTPQQCLVSSKDAKGPLAVFDAVSKRLYAFLGLRMGYDALFAGSAPLVEVPFAGPQTEGGEKEEDLLVYYREVLDSCGGDVPPEALLGALLESVQRPGRGRSAEERAATEATRTQAFLQSRRPTGIIGGLESQEKSQRAVAEASDLLGLAMARCGGGGEIDQSLLALARGVQAQTPLLRHPVLRELYAEHGDPQRRFEAECRTVMQQSELRRFSEVPDAQAERAMAVAWLEAQIPQPWAARCDLAAAWTEPLGADALAQQLAELDAAGLEAAVHRLPGRAKVLVCGVPRGNGGGSTQTHVRTKLGVQRFLEYHAREPQRTWEAASDGAAYLEPDLLSFAETRDAQWDASSTLVLHSLQSPYLGEPAAATGTQQQRQRWRYESDGLTLEVCAGARPALATFALAGKGERRLRGAFEAASSKETLRAGFFGLGASGQWRATFAADGRVLLVHGPRRLVLHANGWLAEYSADGFGGSGVVARSPTGEAQVAWEAGAAEGVTTLRDGTRRGPTASGPLAKLKVVEDVLPSGDGLLYTREDGARWRAGPGGTEWTFAGSSVAQHVLPGEDGATRWLLGEVVLERSRDGASVTLSADGTSVRRAGGTISVTAGSATLVADEAACTLRVHNQHEQLAGGVALTVDLRAGTAEYARAADEEPLQCMLVQPRWASGTVVATVRATPLDGAFASHQVPRCLLVSGDGTAVRFWPLAEVQKQFRALAGDAEVAESVDALGHVRVRVVDAASGSVRVLEKMPALTFPTRRKLREALRQHERWKADQREEEAQWRAYEAEVQRLRVQDHAEERVLLATHGPDIPFADEEEEPEVVEDDDAMDSDDRQQESDSVDADAASDAEEPPLTTNAVASSNVMPSASNYWYSREGVKALQTMQPEDLAALHARLERSDALKSVQVFDAPPLAEPASKSVQAGKAPPRARPQTTRPLVSQQQPQFTTAMKARVQPARASARSAPAGLLAAGLAPRMSDSMSSMDAAGSGGGAGDRPRTRAAQVDVIGRVRRKLVVLPDYLHSGPSEGGSHMNPSYIADQSAIIVPRNRSLSPSKYDVSSGSGSGVLSLLPTSMRLERLHCGNVYRVTVQVSNTGAEPLRVRVKLPETMSRWVEVNMAQLAKSLLAPGMTTRCVFTLHPSESTWAQYAAISGAGAKSDTLAIRETIHIRTEVEIVHLPFRCDLVALSPDGVEGVDRRPALAKTLVES